MKQEITITQVRKLSKKGRENFDKWMDYNGLPNIGQMIEFLDEHNYFDCPCEGKTKNWVCIFKDKCAGEWFIEDHDPRKGYKRKTFIDEYELCDALWEATKKVLET